MGFQHCRAQKAMQSHLAVWMSIGQARGGAALLSRCGRHQQRQGDGGRVAQARGRGMARRGYLAIQPLARRQRAMQGGPGSAAHLRRCRIPCGNPCKMDEVRSTSVIACGHFCMSLTLAERLAQCAICTLECVWS